MAKVWRRIVPLMALVLFFSYLDKVNIGFAALTMNADLGFSNTVFGAGAGSFAIGYALFAIPSTLLLHRLGARRWIAVIMIAWGVCSAATAFVETPRQLLAIRLLLGMAEAGFNPGVILYFTYWFPSEYRGRVLGSFLFIMPVGLSIAAPISSWLLGWDGVLGLAGWQWLFIVEALPTVLLAALVWYALTDQPADANWLAPTAKDWLVKRLAAERAQIKTPTRGMAAVRQVLANKRVWLLTVVNLGVGTSGIGAVIFLPLVIQSMGFSISSTGLLAALPSAVAAALLPVWGYWTDRARNRESVVAAACACIAGGLLGAAWLLPSAWALAAVCIAMVGFYGSIAAFWTLPSAFLTGASAAAGIAFINIAGNLGTFTGPSLIGWLADRSGSYSSGFSFLALLAACSGALLAWQALGARRVICRAGTD
jgi:MFS transporter, ACS family, tartrate transporter